MSRTGESFTSAGNRILRLCQNPPEWLTLVRDKGGLYMRFGISRMCTDTPYYSVSLEYAQKRSQSQRMYNNEESDCAKSRKVINIAQTVAII